MLSSFSLNSILLVKTDWDKFSSRVVLAVFQVYGDAGCSHQTESGKVKTMCSVHCLLTIIICFLSNLLSFYPYNLIQVGQVSHWSIYLHSSGSGAEQLPGFLAIDTQCRAVAKMCRDDSDLPFKGEPLLGQRLAATES